jgi:glycosyltransferase involved in cell wall biosynthesis
MTEIPVRMGLQQRVLPEYRAPFFDMLGAACEKGLSVFAGSPRANEAIATCASLENAHFQQGKNIHISSGKTYLCIQQGLLNWLETWQPQVLIVEANPRYLSSPSAVRWMHKRGRPVIGWGLGAPRSSGVESIIWNHFLGSLDALIAYSRMGAEQYRSTGFDSDRIFIAANAASPRPVDRPLQRPGFFKDGKASLLFVGRLQERKRLDVLLNACALFPESIQPHLVIVGDGPDRELLEKLAREVYPSSQFVSAKFGLELEPYFNTADIFVLPGTGGLAVQQAMAHALPVIVGEADGTQSELVRPENGWVLPSSEAHILSKYLLKAIKDVNHLRQMGLASYQIVSQEINLENMVEGFAKAIKFVL